MKVTLSLNPQGEAVVAPTPAQRESLGRADRPVSDELTVDSASSLTERDFGDAVTRVMEQHGALFEALAEA